MSSVPQVERLRGMLVDGRYQAALEELWQLLEVLGGVPSTMLFTGIIDQVATDVLANAATGRDGRPGEVILTFDHDQVPADMRVHLQRVCDLVAAALTDNPADYTARVADTYRDVETASETFAAAISLWSNVLAGNQHTAVVDLREAGA